MRTIKRFGKRVSTERGCAVLVLALASAGCFYPAGRGKQLEQHVQKLEQDRETLLASVDADRKRMNNEVAAKIAEVTKALDLLDRSSKRSGADLGVQIERLTEELGQLRGLYEQSAFKLNQLETRVASGKPVDTTSPQTAKIERPTDKVVFATLVESTLADNPALGQTLGFEWLAKWPKDPFAAKVHYQLGLSYQRASQWRTALSEYGEIARDFEQSAQAPDAALRSAECFSALKMTAEARLSLEELLRLYPKSDAAKTGKIRLAAMPPPKSK